MRIARNYCSADTKLSSASQYICCYEMFLWSTIENICSRIRSVKDMRKHMHKTASRELNSDSQGLQVIKQPRRYSLSLLLWSPIIQISKRLIEPSRMRYEWLLYHTARVNRPPTGTAFRAVVHSLTTCLNTKQVWKYNITGSSIPIATAEQCISFPQYWTARGERC